MTILNWLALVLSVVLWVIQLYIGHGVGMASSTPMKKGSPEYVYLDRVEAVRGIVWLGAILTFITQLIDVPWVKTVGLVILAIALLSVAVFLTGLLQLGLPKGDASGDSQRGGD